MSFIKSSASAFGKLFIVLILAATFVFGMVGVVYMSLQGEEIKVPELTGKDVNESEAELSKLGLKIKERARRFSSEKQNTILEQLPKAGETVKTGQMILVVVSKQNPNGEVPDTIKKDDEKDDIEKIEELISDKPKKTSKTADNSNKKKSSKTRDVIANKSSDDASDADKAEKKTDGDKTDKSAGDDKKPASTTGDKPSTQKPSDKSDDKKPTDKKPADKNTKPTNTPNSTLTRPRKTP